MTSARSSPTVEKPDFFASRSTLHNNRQIIVRVRIWDGGQWHLVSSHPRIYVTNDAKLPFQPIKLPESEPQKHNNAAKTDHKRE
jgi:hypothetical protein